MARILITGSAGVVGSALGAALSEQGHAVVGLDIAAIDERFLGDVTHTRDVASAVQGCDGIVHLAAVSRVVWGQQAPEKCKAVNSGGTQNVVRAALASAKRPWIVFSSSREVYGDPKELPATEDTPLSPLNVYGRSKVAGEEMMAAAAAEGLNTAVVRLSNVYGALNDHADRVVPAFVAAGVAGGELRIDGSQHTFDFCHIEDTVRGLVALIERLEAGERLPAIHFATGVPTTLGELAALAVELGRAGATVREAPPRDYDVSRFYADPARAKKLLGWTPQVALRDGMARLAAAMRAAQQE